MANSRNCCQVKLYGLGCLSIKPSLKREKLALRYAIRIALNLSNRVYGMEAIQYIPSHLPQELLSRKAFRAGLFID